MWADPPPPGPTRAELLGGHALEATFDFDWQDARGFRWNVHNRIGSLHGNADGAYKSAMTLFVNHVFDVAEQSIAGEDRRTYILQRYDDVQVQRLLRADQQRAAVRCIDVITNTGDQPHTVALSWRTVLHSPASTIITNQGRRFNDGGAFEIGEVGFMASHPPDDSRPIVMFVLADNRAALRPTVEVDDDEIFVNSELVLQPGETRAFVQFIAQRKPDALDPDKREQAFRSFHNNGLVRAHLPDVLDGKVVNFGELESPSDRLRRPVSALASYARTTERETTTLVINSQTRLQGPLTSGHFTIETRFGSVRVPAPEVMCLIGGNGKARRQRLFLRSGEILAGRVQARHVRLETKKHDTIAIDPAGLDVLVAKATPADARPPANAAMRVHTHAGDALLVREPGAQPLHVATPWGTLEVPLTDVLRIQRRWSEETPPHYHVYLRDGGEIAGFLQSDVLQLDSLRFGAIELPVSRLTGMIRIKQANTESGHASLPTHLHRIKPGITLAGEIETNGNLTVVRTAYGTMHAPRVQQHKTTTDAHDAAKAGRPED